MATTPAILRPNTTLQIDSPLYWTTGAASFNAALSDNSDATVADHANHFPTNDRLAVGFGTVALPALAVVKSVTPRLRWGHSTGSVGFSFTAGVRVSSGTVTQFASYLNAMAVYHTDTYGALTTRPGGGAWTQADIDGLEMVIDSSGLATILEAYLDVVYNEVPVVTTVSTSPNSPVTTTTTPSVTWAYADPESDVQERFRVKIYQGTGAVPDPDATPAYIDSGEVFSSAAAWLITTPLAPGSYRASVKAADAGSNGRYSAWATNTFTIQVDPPAAPVISSVTVDAALARIAVAVAGFDNLLSANQSSLEVDASGWEADVAAATPARTTTPAASVHGVAALSWVASGANSAVRTSAANGARFAVPPAGTTITARASLKSADALSRTGLVGMRYYNSSNSLIAGTYEGSTAGFSGTHGVVSYTGVIPAGAVTGVLYARVTNSANTNTFFLDVAAVVPGTSTTWSKGGFTNIVYAVERTVDGGTTWVPVRGALGQTVPLGTQVLTIYDYEVARGVTPSYRARTRALDLQLNTTVVSADSATVVSAAMATTGWWIKDPLSPGLNMQLEVEPGFSFRRKEPQSTFEPVGRNVSVVVSDGVRGIEGEITVWAKTKARYDKLQAVVTSGHSLWFEDVFGRAWYIKLGDSTQWSLLRALPIAGETTPIRHLHSVTLPFVEVGAPAGDTVVAGTPVP